MDEEPPQEAQAVGDVLPGAHRRGAPQDHAEQKVAEAAVERLLCRLLAQILHLNSIMVEVDPFLFSFAAL